MNLRRTVFSLPNTAISAITVFCLAPAVAAEDYKLGPDAKVQDGVPQGDIIEGDFDQSKVFPGTTRKYWIYVPKQYKKSEPAAVMIFQMAAAT